MSFAQIPKIESFPEWYVLGLHCFRGQSIYTGLKTSPGITQGAGCALMNRPKYPMLNF